MSARVSRPARTRERLTVQAPHFVAAPAGQREQLLSALRTLFREHLEERLASGAQTSVDEPMGEEPPQ